MRIKKVDATQGKISTGMWRLAWPILIGHMIQVVYNLADTYWVGRLENSTESIAAVSVSFSVIFVLISLAGGLSVATATLAAQYFGAKKHDEVKKVAYTSLVMLVILSVLMIVIGLPLNETLFRLIRTPESVLTYALEYFNIMLVGMGFMFGFFLLSGYLRGIGDTKTPMIIGVVSAVINIILDPILIFGIGPIEGLGIAGAAYATIISKLIVMVYLLIHMFSGRFHVHLLVKEIRLDMTILKQMAKIGMPAAGTQVIISMGSTLIMGRVNTFGEVATAVQGLGQRLDNIMFMPAMGLSQAAATMVGQNLGAGNKERALASAKYAISSAFFILLGIGVIFFLFPTVFLGLFSDDAAVIDLGRYYIRFLSISYGFLGIRIVMNGAFQGAGAAMTSMILSIVSLWGFRIPFAYIFSYTPLGVRGLWLGIAVSFVISSGVMGYWFHKGTWLNKALVEATV